MVLDFEANCLRGEQIDPQEIIEFPCLMVDSENFTVVSKFHHYVKPVGEANITPFCTELTGITQDMVAMEPTWEEVLEMFVSWYTSNNLSPQNSTFVTCGLWDLKTALPKQCQYSQLVIPEMLDVGSSGEYINIKYSFQKHTGTYAKVGNIYLKQSPYRNIVFLVSRVFWTCRDDSIFNLRADNIQVKSFNS